MNFAEIVDGITPQVYVVQYVVYYFVGSRTPYDIYDIEFVSILFFML